MMMRTRLVASVLIASGLMAGLLVGWAGCSLGGESPELAGSWHWTRSVGGFAGWTLTPDTEGHTQRLELGPASEFAFFRDDSLVTRGAYSIKSEGEAPVIRYETESSWWFFAEGQRIERRGPDTLVFHDRCADCYTHTFVRK